MAGVDVIPTLGSELKVRPALGTVLFPEVR